MIEPSAETSATSAHAYAAGDHFIYNGTLYRATAAIAIGDTITPESNCVATTVMTEVEAGGGGGGGTSDYTQLSNKPQINGNTLTGNKTGADLGLVNAVTGKQLSTEDYTTAEKTKLSGIEAQANKTVIDSTLTQTGQAADAKAAGDAVSELRNTLNAAEDEVETVENGLAIPQTGDTCSRDSGIPIGAFIFLQGHSSLADGIYQNTSNSIIEKNASFTSSNLTRCYQENGVLNLLAFSIKYFNATKPVVDCNSGTDSIFELFFCTNANTLNTPYKQGLTSATVAIILNLNGTSIYNTQLAFLAGISDVYIRTRGPSGWGAWKKAF